MNEQLNRDDRLLSNMGVVAAIARNGSLARAGEALGISASGVSKSLARLEGRLGVRLFDRNTRSAKLTDEGRRLYEEITPLLSSLRDAVERTALAKTVVTGRLRVNVDPFFARLMLAPHVTEFLQTYEDLELDLVQREQLGDLVGEGFDIAIRFGEPPPSALIARKLLQTKVITVASPGYLKRYGTPDTPDDLASHICIRTRSPMTGDPVEWRFRKGDTSFSVPAPGRLTVGDPDTLLATCLAGAGIARIKAAGVAPYLSDGRLIQLLSNFAGESYSLYALYPSRKYQPAKVRLFLQFLQERIRTLKPLR